MIEKQPYNALLEGFQGEQKRRTEFVSKEEKIAYDADGLINLARETYKRRIVTVQEALDLTRRADDSSEYLGKLRKEIASQIKNPEQVEIDERLMALVVDPIKQAYSDGVRVQGLIRTAEEIARAIPDVEAFLAEVDLQKEDGILLDFFELNESGQLVMKDNCKEAYGLGENALEARMRQTRIVYKEDGSTKVMTGEECFNVTKELRDGRPLEMELFEAAKKIDTRSILMARELPIYNNKHVGEYARMNTGQLETGTYTWTKDDSLDASRARYAGWYGNVVRVFSVVDRSDLSFGNLGSRGVLRVNLDFES